MSGLGHYIIIWDRGCSLFSLPNMYTGPLFGEPKNPCLSLNAFATCPQGGSSEAISFESKLFTDQTFQPSHLKARERTERNSASSSHVLPFFMETALEDSNFKNIGSIHCGYGERIICLSCSHLLRLLWRFSPGTWISLIMIAASWWLDISLPAYSTRCHLLFGRTVCCCHAPPH